MSKRSVLRIGGVMVRAGELRDIHLPISETYTGDPVSMPIRVIRAKKPGPRVLITAAVHGNELNGTGVIREMLFDEPPSLVKGAIVCVPVINVFGFERNERYLPDGRDMNRSFPGSTYGSLASRVANTIMTELVAHCDCCLDLHSAAQYRTNFPNVRGDLRNQKVRSLAEAFGCELIVNGKGPEGSMRRAACDAGCPTIILEAGEVSKIEPSVLEIGLRGIHNVLRSLGMTKGAPIKPPYQASIRRTTWIRAELGGLLRFHVAPGDIVSAGQPIASNESVFGESKSVLIAPVDGIVLGMTTLPAVKPGEPVCHLAVPRQKIANIRRALKKTSRRSLPHRLRSDLATNISIDNEPSFDG